MKEIRTERGGRNPNEAETLREAGIRCLSLGELSCWQIKRHVVNKLIKNQDSEIDIQGKSAPFFNQCDSPCQVGAGICIQASVEDSCFMNLLEGRSKILENQEFLTGRVQNPWSKIYLSETQNYQRSCKQTQMKNQLCIFAPYVNIFSCISSHDDDTVHRRDRAHNSDCGKVSPLLQQTYHCSDCEKAFSDGHSLELHRQVHSGKKSPPYGTHDKGSGYSAAVAVQQSVYTGKKRYWCHECGKGFSQSSNLQTHQRVHTGEKPYSCLECGKSFNQTSHLYAHLPIHTGEKPYRCESCGKGFSRSTDLNIHCRVHSEVAPAGPREDPHRRETIQVWRLREALQL